MKLETEEQGEAKDDACIKLAFLLVIGHVPAANEYEAAGRFLKTQPSRYPSLAKLYRCHRALVDFCQMMLASNAFLYIE